MYNLIEYNSNYSERKVSLWFYSKDEASTDNFNFLKYKAKLLENTVSQPVPNAANGILRNATIAVPLKYLSNFSGSLEMPLINLIVVFSLQVVMKMM